MKNKYYILLIFVAFIFNGCSSDPTNAETHFPKWYYKQIEKEDMDWLNNPTE